MQVIGSCMQETGMGSYNSWFSEQEWDHVFSNNPPDGAITYDVGEGEQLMDVDLDAPEWSSWDDLIIDVDINGCSGDTNNSNPNSNPSLPANLQAIEEHLMDVELQDGNNNFEEDAVSCPRIDDAINANSSCKSVETDNAGSSSVDIDHAGSHENRVSQDLKTMSDVEYKGLRLLHLLTACAEAISEGAQDLAEVVLCRLRGLVSPTGSTMERVAYYLFNALVCSNNMNSLGHLEPNDKSMSTSSAKEHFLGALNLLHVAYPYIRIGHFTANQCILEAIAGTGSTNVGIHIIDFDIMEGMQWPPLMEALRSNGDYEIDHLRITTVKWVDEGEDDEAVLYTECCKHTGRRLSEYAESLGIPFLFQETDLKGLKDLMSEDGEIVIVNCMWQLPHMVKLRSKKQLLEFLVGTRHLNPEAVTLATGPHGNDSAERGDFIESFAGCLKDLCTIFDSLEAGLPEHGLARAMVERMFFGPAMSRRLIRSPESGESNVVDIAVKCGYGEGTITSENIMYAKYTLELCRGAGRYYEVALVGRNRLVLKWASAPVVWVSTWKSP